MFPLLSWWENQSQPPHQSCIYTPLPHYHILSQWMCAGYRYNIHLLLIIQSFSSAYKLIHRRFSFLSFLLFVPSPCIHPLLFRGILISSILRISIYPSSVKGWWGQKPVLISEGVQVLRQGIWVWGVWVKKLAMQTQGRG